MAAQRRGFSAGLGVMRSMDRQDSYVLLCRKVPPVCDHVLTQYMQGIRLSVY